VFLLKKLVSFWIMPLPFCTALLVAGLLLMRRPRRQRLGRGLIIAAVGLLVVLSNQFVSTRIVRPLEDRYPAIPEIAPGSPAPAVLAGCGFVAVLGGGNSDMAGLSATSQLSSSSLARLVEAVRLLRALPGARLLVSGPGSPGLPAHGTMLSRGAQSLGVDPARITVIDTALDTEDEAGAVARIAGPSRVALVTSAWHMPRAAALFRRAGVDFVPCPADFVARVERGHGGSELTCDVESLARSTRGIHEWLGLLWLRLRGAG